MSNRPETGAMKFGGDWPGVFVRGDNAGMYALHLETLLDNIESTHSRRSRSGRQQRRQDMNRRRLPCSVVPEEAEDLTCGDRQVDPVQHLDVAVAVYKAHEFDCRVGSRCRPLCGRVHADH